MTRECFDHQKTRLIDRFGKNNFSSEFSLLVLIECKTLTDQEFVEIVNFFIGSRPANKPPMVFDFRDARIAKERLRFQRDVDGAARAMEIEFQGGLKAYLAKAFPGCRNLDEAVEVRRLQIQVAKAEDPFYDPMKDPKWN
jgi:hypothetical protein